MRWKILGIVVIVFAAGFLWTMRSHESGNTISKRSAVLENTSVGKVSFQKSITDGSDSGTVSVAGIKVKVDTAESMPALSENEKAYNRTEALEKREAKMKGRMAYIQARIAWRRALNAAQKSGDDREVDRIMAEAPDKKTYMQGG